MERAERARARKDRRAFRGGVVAGRGGFGVRAAQKKLGKELWRDIRMEAKVRSKAQKAKHCALSVLVLGVVCKPLCSLVS